jgi:hypothetical protein
MTEWVATKKGIVLTAIILGIITAASFSIWLIPQHENSSFVISDYRSELDSIKERHGVIIKEIDGEWKNMIAGSLSPDDFIIRAQTSASQINSLLSEVIESRASQEWRESYLNYSEALKKYNDYLTETIVIANKVKGGVSINDLKDELQKLDTLKNESESYTIKANETKP